MNIVFKPVDELAPHPRNPNTHSQEQIERLAKLIAYQGWRLPIIVSNESGYIVSGHGRLAAAKHLGLKEVPVSFQEFKDSDQEYAFLVSDNAIASWSDLDLASINDFVKDLGPDFEMEHLGMVKFNILPPMQEEEPKPKKKKSLLTQCPECAHCFEAYENPISIEAVHGTTES